MRTVNANSDPSSSYDIIVVGSGAAALTAALAATSHGLSVIVVERSSYLGGTSAISGGALWVPNSRAAVEAGHVDSPADALAYLLHVIDGRTPHELASTFLEQAPRMVDFVESRSPLTFSVIEGFPDYQTEAPGASPGGRSIEPGLIDLGTLDPVLREALRPPTTPPFTLEEYRRWQAYSRFDWDELEQRAANGLAARGQALVAGLLVGLQDRCDFVVDARVTGLLYESERVSGVSVNDREIAARRGVVLACGGFEWDQGMMREFLAGPVLTRCSPPHNTGDGIRMASVVGASIRLLREAWWAPMTDVPGTTIDNVQTGTLLRFERSGPGSIMVDRSGRRFCNEAQNYNEMTRVFHSYDPVGRQWRHIPAYLIFDESHLRDYGFLTHRSGQPTPDWITTAASPAELARAIDVDADQFVATLERFNANAAQGVDPEFGRGGSAYDNYWGDAEARYPSLGPVNQGPYYAVEVKPGVFGTSGGIETDSCARALRADGTVIRGLFAAGNTTRVPTGGGYPGGGATLGPGNDDGTHRREHGSHPRPCPDHQPLTTKGIRHMAHTRHLLEETDGRRIIGSDSATFVPDLYAKAKASDDVIVNASYSGVFCATIVAEFEPKGVIGLDCGIGLEGAGISGLWFYEGRGIPAAAVDVDTAEMGNARDMWATGIISRRNGLAQDLGVEEGMTVPQAARLLAADARPVDTEGRLAREDRRVMETRPNGVQIVATNSHIYARPEDINTNVLCCGGNCGQAAAYFMRTEPLRGLIGSDGGGGKNNSGTIGMYDVEKDGLAVATVDAHTARMGDGLSTYLTGIISAANSVAQAKGVRVGMRASEAAILLADN